RRAARAGEDAQVVLRSESPVLALVERVATSPDRGREEDAVGVFDTRRGQLGERLSDRAESRDDGVGAHAEVRKDALGSGEALENAEWGEDRRDERGVGEDLAHKAHTVEELLESGLAHRSTSDARPILGLAHRVALEHGVPVFAVAVPRAPRFGVVVRARVVLDQVELMP